MKKQNFFTLFVFVVAFIIMGAMNFTSCNTDNQTNDSTFISVPIDTTLPDSVFIDPIDTSVFKK